MTLTAGQRHPPDEVDRLAAVRRYDILDTPPDGSFDRVTALAARLAQTPISTITIVDEDRIWFKSKVGVDVDEIGRDPGLCASAILQDGPYVVTDAAVDARTLDNPLVRGDLGLRFYAAVPLITSDGHRLGTLNVIDAEPREITADQLAHLGDLAAIVMDELELRLAARRTVELEAVREASRYRDTILAGISHELRTPLAVLKAAASLEDDADAEVREVVRRQVQHLDWLISQFLSFTTLEGDRLPRPELTTVDLPSLVGQATELVSDRGEIRTTVAAASGRVLADSDRTSQIVLELLHNAVRFGADAGPVDVLIEDHEDGTVGVTVGDRGPGVAVDDRERVFDRFHRQEDSTGSGVGLYVARALAEAQGGSLVLEPSEEPGSRFTLLLPAAQDG